MGTGILKKHVLKKSAQAATELAVFGTILIFVISLIVRAGLNTGQTMNTQLKAFRLALTTSYRASEGQYSGIQWVSSASRRTASVLIVEDRLSITSGEKISTQDRTPLIASASATYTKNMFMPVDFGDHEDLPVFDLFVNGQHFPLTVAGFCPGDPGCSPVVGPPFYKTVGHSLTNVASGDFDINCDSCFDLNRDGTVDVTDMTERASFLWQWKAVNSVEPGQFADIDGDLKAETILETEGGLKWTDNQIGDVDFTINTRDNALRIQQGKPPLEVGFRNDIQMFSFTQDGTLLRVEEGNLFDPETGEFVRSTSRVNHLDIIQRTYALSNDTDRFCDANGNPTDWSVGVWRTSDLTNPVEACNNCFSVANRDKTCMDEEGLVIFIRSRIRDLRGRRWVTRFNT